MKRSKAKKQRSPSAITSRKKKAVPSGHVSARELLRATEALERNTNELALSLSMMQATLDSTTDAIVVTDMNGNVRNFNEKYARMMGVTREELKRADVNKLRLKFSQRFKDPEGFMTRVREIYRTAPSKTFEVMEWKDGTILERYSQVQLLDQEPVGRVWSFRDVTERKRAEENLEAAKVAAEQANQAKDDFLASLSHELRTPLMPAMIAAGYLAEHEKLAPELREDVVAILRNVQLEAQLINDLLDVTRITRGKIEVHHEVVDVHLLLENAVQIVKADITAKAIEFTIDLAAPIHHIWADPVRIQQVFWNLMNNAVKFTPKNGKIRIRTYNKGKHFAFEITDTGIGIDPERQESIFEPFHQGERSITRRFGGLGLGLTISKTLLDLHGGRITVESAGPNKGSTFRIFLDLLREPVPSSGDGASGVVATAKKLRLLLVDDHADTRGVLSRLLVKCGHEVMTADSAQKALEILDTGRFDALISDIGLPEVSGYELVRQAKRRQPLAGIALSGLGMDEDVRRSLEAGFDHHLTKPINFQDLESVLGKIST
ncbi:MAG TPA: ATP-binding protein [Chthoniobacterales bacterium]|nr:ATP-binding protein [Chthoniobacterales bacterium]